MAIVSAVFSLAVVPLNVCNEKEEPSALSLHETMDLH